METGKGKEGMMDLVERANGDPQSADTADKEMTAGSGDEKTARELDQFYTLPHVAAKSMRDILAWMKDEEGYDPDQIATWIEPSAGAGAFLDVMPEPRIGIDLDPKRDDIIKADFLETDQRKKMFWKGILNLKKPVATIGNPPFGRNCSLAIKFMNRAAQFSDWIGVIVPRTFEKEALQNKLDRRLRLAKTFSLDAESFEHEGEVYAVPCCLQLWQRMPIGFDRGKSKPVMKHPHFNFVADPGEAHFAFQRVGVRAGAASKEGLKRSWKSNHFIKVVEGVDWKTVMDDLNSINWKSISEKTAGNPSIGKGEMIAAYAEIHPIKEDRKTTAGNGEPTLFDQL